MPSLLSTNAGPASSLTWGQAKVRVARAGSGSGTEENLEAARDCLQETIQFWNARKHWRFLHTIADDIPLVVGQASYALPTNCKVVYSAHLEGLKRELEAVEIKYSQAVGYIAPSNGAPTHYTMFNSSTTGEITLTPPPDSTSYGPLVVYYYRDMATAGSDDSPLDCPARYEHAILAGARVRYLALKGDESAKIQVWNKLAEEGLLFAISDDNNQPDQMTVFRPKSVTSTSSVLTVSDGIIFREDYW